MKTIEQKAYSKINITEGDDYLNFKQCGAGGLVLEKTAIPDLIQALLPPGKAIIDVPEFEGYEYVTFHNIIDDNEYALINNYLESYWKGYRFSSPMLIYRKIEKQEPFIWPEHLPDGTELKDMSAVLSGPLWVLYVMKGPSMSIESYNQTVRPSDRITIPDWLESEPRTLVKGEE